MLNLKNLQHIGVCVADASKNAQWYIDALGFVKMGEFHTDDGFKAVFVKSEKTGAMYEFYQHPEGSAGAAEMDIRKGVLDHIAYEVDDLEGEYKKAVEEGLEVLQGLTDIPSFWDNGFRYFIVKSPAGDKVEICKVL
jgi:catechol 2,3-dioxygenase-like lactoylglutathione lyase family enzyme